MEKTNLNESTLEQMLKAMTRTGAIPKNMYGAIDPRMPVFGEKPDYFVEVDFND
jgi:hypothetical protein